MADLSTYSRTEIEAHVKYASRVAIREDGQKGLMVLLAFRQQLQSELDACKGRARACHERDDLQLALKALEQEIFKFSREWNCYEQTVPVWARDG